MHGTIENISAQNFSKIQSINSATSNVNGAQLEINASTSKTSWSQQAGVKDQNTNVNAD